MRISVENVNEKFRVKVVYPHVEVSGPEPVDIKVDGKPVVGEKAILEFIEKYEKPSDINILKHPEDEWKVLKASSIFRYLFNNEERVDCYVEAFATDGNLGKIVYERVRARYPDEVGELKVPIDELASCKVMQLNV